MTDPRPDLPTAADAIYAALIAERDAGRIPPEAAVSVLVVADVSLCICLEGLARVFLFGAEADPLGAAMSGDYTPEAQRLGHLALDTARLFMPRTESGELRHFFDVHLLTDLYDPTTPAATEGVRVLRRKDTT